MTVTRTHRRRFASLAVALRGGVFAALIAATVAGGAVAAHPSHVDTAETPGVSVDAAPIPNFLATIEAQLQQVLAGKESPAALTRTLQAAYSSHGRSAQYGDTDGEF